jgi:nitrous oxide reductase accessory protein NosL
MLACLWADEPAESPTFKKQEPPVVQKGISPEGALQPGPKDHCPVCGMFPARAPKFAAAVELHKGRAFYFCTNSCLLISWRKNWQHLGVIPEAVEQMLVRDYFSGAVLDAQKAWWVAGSDVIGPMGPALVTLQSQKAVEAFKKRHGGRFVFQLHEVDDLLWQNILKSQLD